MLEMMELPTPRCLAGGLPGYTTTQDSHSEAKHQSAQWREAGSDTVGFYKYIPSGLATAVDMQHRPGVPG
jgi:hypothetical protein